MTQSTAVGFEEWARRAAMDGGWHDEAPPSRRVLPSFAEAAASLTSPGLLAPREPDGPPSFYRQAGDEEAPIIALYAAAFIPSGEEAQNHDVLTVTDHGEGEINVAVVGVAWGPSAAAREGRPRAKTLFSERALPLSLLACADVEDLRRLHARIASSRHGEHTPG